MDETYDYPTEEAYVEEDAHEHSGYPEYGYEGNDDAFDPEDDMAYYEDDQYLEDLPGYEDDVEYEEAYATYLDARKRFAELKTNRGFYPVVALAPDGNAGTAPPPRQHQRPRPPTKGAGKGKRVGSKGTGKIFQKGSAKARGKAAMSGPRTCLRCGSPDHLVADCPQQRQPPPTPSPQKRPREQVNMVTEAPDAEQVHLVNFTERQPAGFYAQQDGGASSLVSGTRTLLDYIAYYHTLGGNLEHFRFRRLQTERIFHFGGDHTKLAHWSAHLPVVIDGQAGRLKCFFVDGNTPMLLARSWQL